MIGPVTTTGLQLGYVPVINPLVKGFQQTFEVLNKIVSENEKLEKVAKNFVRASDMAALITGSISSSLSSMTENVRNYTIVYDSVKIFGATKALVGRDEDGKYIWTNPKNTWQRVADRVFLFAHSAFKTYRGVVKAGLATYGELAKNIIGSLPIFTFLMDGLVTISNIFSIWDLSISGLPKANKKIADAEQHITKWKCRKLDIEFLRSIGDQITVKRYENKYLEKSKTLDKKLADTNAALEKVKAESNFPVLGTDSTSLKAYKQKMSDCQQEINSLQEKINHIGTKIIQNNGRLDKIRNHDYAGLAADLAKGPIDAKIRKWEVVKSNSGIPLTQSWLGVAHAISKIAVIVVALTVTAINLWTLPFALTVLSLGMLSDTLGLVKLLQKDFDKPAPIPSTTLAIV